MVHRGTTLATTRATPLVTLLIGLLATLSAASDGQRDTRAPGHDDRGRLEIDSLSFELAAATGGDFYFWAPGEFARSALRIPLQGEAVHLAYGAPSDASLPIESGVIELVVFVGAQRLDSATLRRPDGSGVRHDDADLTVQSYDHMRIFSVGHPPPGTWRLELEGDGVASVSAHVRAADEAIFLYEFEYLEPRGRPGHEGLFRIERAIPPGETHPCRALLSGAIETALFELVTGEGRPLRTLDLERQDDDSWQGRCTVPPEPYRLRVRGDDTRGEPYQRIMPALYRPASSATAPANRPADR